MTAAVTENNGAGSGSSVAGRVVRVIGPVVDVEFPRGAIPELFNALHAEITLPSVAKTLTLEVAQHLGDNLVRTVSMQPTDGLIRGTSVSDTGRPISVPVATSSRATSSTRWATASTLPVRVATRAVGHPPQATSLRPARGQDGDPRDRHQGHRPPHPVRQGWKDRSVRWCRCRQDRSDPGNDHPYRPRVLRHLGVRRRR